MFYTTTVFKHFLGIVATCVAGVTLTACVADPPPPIQWKEVFTQRGIDLGFGNPHVRGTDTLMMHRHGCVLVQRLDSNLITTMYLEGANGQESKLLRVDITPGEIEPDLRAYGCNK